jgi:streptogrisin C
VKIFLANRIENVPNFLACAALFGIVTSSLLPSMVATAHAQGQNAPDPGEPTPKPRMSRDSALRQDAEALASARSIPLGQALKALRSEEDSVDEIDKLRREFGGRVAGVYVEHNPEYKIFVRLKGNGAVSNRLLKFASGNIPVQFVSGASSSVEELNTALSQNLDAVKAIFPTLQGVGTDEKSGEAVVIVQATGSGVQDVMNKKSDLFKLMGHPVRIDVVAQAATDSDVRGGGTIVATINGPCTSGFSVKNGTTTGTTTSAHCEGVNAYLNPGGASIPLTYVTGAEIKDADQDVEVHTSAYVERPEFYADSTATARVLTGKRLRSSTTNGNQACHRGNTTGYSCGTVNITNFTPTWANACGAVSCAAVWVQVFGDAQTACYPGDSGGPVFASQTAFGLLKGTSASGQAKGQCAWFVYMSTDYLPTGWSLIYGP